MKYGVPYGYTLSRKARHPKGMKYGVPYGYEFFSIISSRLWKDLLPTMEKNYSRRQLSFLSSLLQEIICPFSTRLE
ncbi:hypothetical protein, partial [Anaerostipes caccae]